MRQKGRHTKLLAILRLAFIPAAWGSLALGQDGPILVTRTEEPPAIHFDSMRLSLEGRFRYRSDSLDTGLGSEVTSGETRFEELLRLRTTGYSIHPNLISFTANLELGLQQGTVDSGGNDQNQRTTIIGYSLSATILRKEIAPLVLFASRNQETTSQEFTGSIDQTFTTTGATWTIRSATCPASLDYRHNTLDQSGFDSAYDYQLTQDTLQLQTDYQITDRQRLSLHGTLDSVDVTGSSAGLGYDTTSGTISHTWALREDDRSNLFSSGHVSLQQGGNAVDRYSWDEILRLQHTDNFWSRYTYRYGREVWDYLDRDQKQHRATARFQHRLYDSLVTTGDAGAVLLKQVGEYKGRDVFGNLGLDYTKKVPWGVLNATVTGSHEQQKEETTGGMRHVIDEAKTYQDPNPIVIQHGNVNLGSIVITNSDGTILYNQGTDYSLVDFPDRVEVFPVTGGLITDGTTVLIDYTFDSPPSNTTVTTGMGTGLRYTVERGPLKGISPYANYFHQDQDTDLDDPTLVFADRTTDTRLGVDYRRRGLLLNAEYEVHDSVFSPYTATRLSGRLSRRWARDLLFTGSAQFTRTDYEDSRTDFMRLTATVRQQLTSRWNYGLRLSWRDEQSTRRGSSQGLEEQLELRWKYRQTEFYALARNVNLDASNSSKTTQLFELRLKRRF